MKDSVLLLIDDHFWWLTWTVQMLDISTTVESSTRKRRFRISTYHTSSRTLGVGRCALVSPPSPKSDTCDDSQAGMHQYSSSSG